MAGQVIARVNGCRHLHFSTHPGTKYRDGNPYAGHVPKSWADHGGFVDPVRFLKTNPRAAAYRPPELPWADVVTASAAAAVRRGGWRRLLDRGGRRGVRDVAARPRVRRAHHARRRARPPPFDPRRYETRALAAPAMGFSVADHQPVVTLAAEHDTPAWGAEALLTATLTSTAGAPLQGAILKLQRFRSGGGGPCSSP